MSIRRVAAAVAALVLGSACGGEDEQAKPSDCTEVPDGRVELEGRISGWDPECLSMPVGTKVTFTARLLDDLPHNLEVSGPALPRPAGTGSPEEGGPLRLDVTLDEPGYHQFVCTIHPAMEGSLYVEE